jgi:hypothetical protein
MNRRRQLHRCQANHLQSYEAFLHANQPSEGHPANDTWDYGQLYRLHMIRAQAAQDFESYTITEDDIDNYLIHSALADNQLDNEERSSRLYELRRVPGGKRTTTDEEEIFFQQSLRTPRPTTGATSSVNTVRTSTTKTSKFQRNHKNPKHIRNISAIVDTGAQVTTMPESAVRKMPNAHNHRDAPPGTAVKYGNGELETIERLVDIGHYEVQVTPDNCAATLISVDQIVEDGHTVTFSKTQTIITDEDQRGATNCSTTAHKDRENGQCPWKPWRTLLYSARTSHCLAWNLDNYRTSTGTRRRNYRGSSSVTCVAAAYMSALPQANDTRTRGRDVLCSTGNKTPVEEHQCHSLRHPYRIQTQLMPNMRPCQETQGRYGAVEATQKV